MAKYALLDMNLLVLFIVGGTNRRYIRLHKNSRQFSESDYDILLRHVAVSAGLMTTAQILSETANLLRQIADPIKSEISTFFKLFVMSAQELQPAAVSAVSDPAYLWLGFNDAAILTCLGADRVLITGDGNLHAAAIERSNGVLHFTELRQSE
ncbi:MULTISPECIES: hypothetical protein [unclassified Methylobacterium]|jgi:hypothetical protein|uniref:hypothetical protein n=1 Tax=unclassified Methylobacterium TaxID=2615210 RepID=UPI0013555723|nr:hypothetical protein [Methylobacterium sp. 2A]MWV22707.1 hypothetical protein [Methylobacterium sp. 2A]